VSTVSTCGAAAALAEETAGLDRFERGGASGFVVGESADPGPHLGVSALVRTTWAHAPLLRLDGNGRVLETLIDHQVGSFVAASVGLWGWLELTADDSFAWEHAPSSSAAWSLRPPVLGAKALVLDATEHGDGLRIAVRAAARGFDDVLPGVLITASSGRARAGVDLEAHVPLEDPANVMGRWSIAAEIPVLDRYAVTADVFGDVTSAGHALHAGVATPVEAVLAGKARLGTETLAVDVQAGVGGGLVAGVGTAQVRAFAGVAFLFDPTPPERAAGATVVARPATSGEESAVAEATDDVTPEEAPAASAPQELVAAHVEGDRIALDDEMVFFDLGKTALRPEALQVLEGAAELLKAHPEIGHVVVEGHSDAIGPEEARLWISFARARAVRNFLIHEGVEASRLTAVGQGADFPRDTNATPQGREKNRRVELHIEQPLPLVPLPAATSGGAR
jgi:outer membrane protein OmpA-like peptidoglycan-associated protein